MRYGLSISEFVKIAQKQNPVYIQYRDKSNDTDKITDNIKKLKSYTTTKIIINDFFELLPYCDGLHLGQDDIDKLQKKLKISKKQDLFKIIKKLHPDKIFGISTKTEQQILQANRFDIDYIGIGAYRDTTTKNIDTVLGEHISYMAKISHHKTCAIGGVKPGDHIAHIDYLAICSGLLADF